MPKLYARSQKLEQGSIALRYLREHRSIDCSAGNDVREANVYISGRNYYLPALVAFVRNNNGDITGYQQILLDKNTGAKADIPAPKRSFGKISGSFVCLSKESNSNITIIAEGLETALSIKEALSEHGDEKKGMRPIRILCLLGINNIKNYGAREGEKIIIAADNDGEASITPKIIAEAASLLGKSGAAVRIVSPSIIGDFNDLLQRDKTGGMQEIKDIFWSVISSLTAKTLAEFFMHSAERDKLNNQTREDLAFVSKYNINEDKLLTAFKHSEERGKTELAKVKDAVMYGERSYNNHIEVIRDINTFGGEVNPEQLIGGELGNKLEGGHLTYLNELRSDALHSYITNYRKLFNEEKECAVTPCELFEVVTKEQQLFAYLKNNHKHAMIRYASKDYKVCDAANVLQEQPELLQDTQKINLKKNIL